MVRGRKFKTVVVGAVSAAFIVGGAAVAVPAAAAGSASDLKGGQSLVAGNALVSGPVVQYRLVMQGDGNLVEYGNGRALWSTGTAGHPGAYFIFQTDGNAVVYSADGKALWSSQTGTTGKPDNTFILGPDGQIEVVNVAARILWENGAPGSDVFSAPDTSTSGMFLHTQADVERLIMQGDGNLVLYVGGTARWSTQTQGNPGAYLAVQADGNVVVYSASHKALWNTHTNGNGPTVTVRLLGSGQVEVAKGSTVLWKAP